MVRERERLNRESRHPIEIGVGIATGEAVAGCMGSIDRLNYTVVGSRVNLASRLCSEAGPMEVVIDDQTLSSLGPDTVRSAEPVDLQLKGFSTRSAPTGSIPVKTSFSLRIESGPEWHGLKPKRERKTTIGRFASSATSENCSGTCKRSGIGAIRDQVGPNGTGLSRKGSARPTSEDFHRPLHQKVVAERANVPASAQSSIKSDPNGTDLSRKGSARPNIGRFASSATSESCSGTCNVPASAQSAIKSLKVRAIHPDLIQKAALRSPATPPDRVFGLSGRR